MICIRIYGFKDDLNLKTIVKKSILFAIDELLPHKRKLNLIVKRKANLLEEHDAYGLCYSTDDPHYYFIDLYKDLDNAELLRTLFHEMTHVKQYAKKELIYKTTYNLWKGRKYVDLDNDWNRPWEREARKYEKLIYNKFIKT
jgi:hypothetical protein